MNNILTLWDIDGNLVNVYKYHTPAYQKAIETVFGIKLSFTEIETNYGMAAREVVAMPLRKKGVDEKRIQSGIEQVLAIYSEQLETGIKMAQKSKVILPGVLALLQKLKEKSIPMGLVTGNIKKAGEAIVKGSNLYDYFDSRVNSYGDKVTQRSKIVLNAINSAKKNGIITNNARIYVFGDTPSDIEAARENNCISVAVIKNSNSDESSLGGDSYHRRRAILLESKPDYLFDDYTNLEKILSILKIE